MGKLIEQTACEKGHTVSKPDSRLEKETLKDADVIIDFSHHDAIFDSVDLALKKKIPLVIGTTGWDDKKENVKKLVEEQDGTLLYAPNFSLGAFFFLKIVDAAAKLSSSFSDYDICALEVHHKEKKDAPSGTAKQMVSSFQQNIPITSMRVGDIFGKHTLIFDSHCDTITLSHEAKSRKGFAQGAIKSAEWIIGKKGWLTLDEMFRSIHGTSHSL